MRHTVEVADSRIAIAAVAGASTRTPPATGAARHGDHLHHLLDGSESQAQRRARVDLLALELAPTTRRAGDRNHEILTLPLALILESQSCTDITRSLVQRLPRRQPHLRWLHRSLIPRVFDQFAEVLRDADASRATRTRR